MDERQLLDLRHKMINQGLSLTIASEPPHQEIIVGAHFYVLLFNIGTGQVQVLHSGIYRGRVTGEHPAARRIFRRLPKPTPMVSVIWDGRSQLQDYMAVKVGLLHNKESGTTPLMLVVGALPPSYTEKRLRRVWESDAKRLATDAQ